MPAATATCDTLELTFDTVESAKVDNVVQTDSDSGWNYNVDAAEKQRTGGNFFCHPAAHCRPSPIRKTLSDLRFPTQVEKVEIESNAVTQKIEKADIDIDSDLWISQKQCGHCIYNAARMDLNPIPIPMTGTIKSRKVDNVAKAVERIPDGFDPKLTQWAASCVVGWPSKRPRLEAFRT